MGIKQYFYCLGHVCVIESKQNTDTPWSNVDESNVVLTVSWNRQQNSKITLPFRPAIAVQNTKLVITDLEPTDTLRVDGAPSILSQVRVISCNDKYITYYGGCSKEDEYQDELLQF